MHFELSSADRQPARTVIAAGAMFRAAGVFYIYPANGQVTAGLALATSAVRQLHAGQIHVDGAGEGMQAHVPFGGRAAMRAFANVCRSRTSGSISHEADLWHEGALPFPAATDTTYDEATNA